MGNKCPTCHSDNPESLKFCGECGTKLDASGPSHPPSPSDRASFTKTLEAPSDELARGTLFADRYEIIEELGAGGMGKVYRAHDTKLNEEVALKLIRPEIAADKRTAERFRNELKVARKIRHKNVCGMYDFHQEGKTLFLTMEYVRGEDLKSLIHRTKTLSIGTAVSIAHQIAEGLAEAHKQGIVHRDLKPGNVMIDQDGQAKIMDFGIARSLVGGGITGEGAIIGTPEYMSPEQVEGKEADQRTDIYALGIILFEMVTGRLPFEGQTPFSIANKHKAEPPPIPKKLVPQIPEGLNKLILRCLEKDRAKRYQTAEELVEDLTAVEEALPLTERALIRARTKTWTSRKITVKFTPKKAIISAIAALVIIASTIILIVTRGPKYDPKRIIVTPFENQTGDKSLDALGQMVSDRIISGLTNSGLVTVIQLPQNEETLKASRSEFVRATARESGAGTLISGSFYHQGKAFSFQASINNVEKGKLIRSIDPVRGPEDETGKAVEETSQRVIGALAVILEENVGASIVDSSHLPTFEAYKAYIHGRELLGRLDSEGAIPFLLKALELDPNYKTCLLSLAAANWNLNRMEQVEKYLEEAEKSREKLGRFDQLNLDIFRSDVRGDWAGDLKAARELVRIVGSEYDAYQWALAANCCNLPREALKALSQLDPKKESAAGWYDYWDLMAAAYHMLGEHNKELRAARRGRKYFPANMRALYVEARALAALGRTAELEKRIEESYGFVPLGGFIDEFPDSLPKAGLNSAYIMIHSAAFLRVNGYKEQSQKVFGQAIQWLENRPVQEKENSYHRAQLASAMYHVGKWDRALDLYSRLSKEEPENIRYVRYLGCLAARLGNREEALNISKKLEEMKRPYLFGQDIYARACIASLLGEKEAAVRLLREATSQGLLYFEHFYRDIDLEPIRGYPPFQEFIKPKG